jgi:Ser/Thr protein kinase RdoA (MazF antagonist)
MSSFSSADSHKPTQVLRFYPVAAESIVDIRAAKSGLSGAQVWLIERRQASPLCLRRWPPEHPSTERLRMIHAVLVHLANSGIDFTPVPIESTSGETFVWCDATRWELTNWLPGRADYRTNPSSGRLAAALESLAQLHLRSAAFPAADTPPRSVSRGITQRASLLSSYASGRLAELNSAARAGEWRELAARADEIIDLFVRHADQLQSVLKHASQLRVPQQPCIRDIHDEHVLYEGNVVTGIIDFGAMRYDNVATDIARVLGSMAGDDAEAWQAGLAAYHDIRPLSSDELSLIPAFDASGILLGSLQWIDWIYLQQRQFSDQAVVLDRVDRLLSRLRCFAPAGQRNLS